MSTNEESEDENSLLPFIIISLAEDRGQTKFYQNLIANLFERGVPTWNEINTLHPTLAPIKTASKLATAQGSTLVNYGKIKFFLVPTRTMEQNKILNKPFRQTFHITDIKHNIIGIPFITKYIPTINILNSKLHIKDKYTRIKTTSLTFFQRLNKKPPFFSKFYPIYNQQREYLKPLSGNV